MSLERICVAITARPSYSRVRTAMKALAATPGIDLKVVCSGSALLDRYGRVVDLIRADGFEVVEELYTFVEGNEPINMALTTANTIQHSALLLRRLAPHKVVTIADRYETLGTAIAAAYVGIPLLHIQGGEITGNIDEKVRHAVTKLADAHLVANAKARMRVIQMGEHPSSVFVTGCPSIDLAREADQLPLSTVQRAVDEQGVGAKADLSSDYIVVLLHPETDSYEQSYERMTIVLEAVKGLGMPALIFWPNVDAGSDATSKAIRVFRESGGLPMSRYLKNMEGHLFLKLLSGSRCLIGNSSVGVRESAYLGVPVVNVGHRQEGRERGPNTVDCDWSLPEISAAIARQLSAGRYTSSAVYGDGFAGEKIAQVIASLQSRSTKRFYEP